jgi:hypothetical protein
MPFQEKGVLLNQDFLQGESVTVQRKREEKVNQGKFSCHRKIVGV